MLVLGMKKYYHRMKPEASPGDHRGRDITHRSPLALHKKLQQTFQDRTLKRLLFYHLKRDCFPKYVPFTIPP